MVHNRTAARPVSRAPLMDKKTHNLTYTHNNVEVLSTSEIHTGDAGEAGRMGSFVRSTPLLSRVNLVNIIKAESILEYKVYHIINIWLII
jgi:hypothetical protein